MTKETRMLVNLKIEALQDHTDISLRRDLMGISLLALLLSPFALAGIMLYGFEASFMTTEILVICIVTLLAALPKLLQLLSPDSEEQ